MDLQFADEYGAAGVNVTVVHPGMTVTERFGDTMAKMARAQGTSAQEVERDQGHRTVIGRVVTAAEVADIICFLPSPRSVALAGDVIAAGGGIRGPVHY